MRVTGYEDLPALMSVLTGDEKHEPASTSTLDVIWVLYDQVLNTTAENFASETRDRFLLSKGHGPMAYYAVLCAKGIVPREWFDVFGSYDSRLGHHPDRTLVPGVEISAGSLGHGLPIAVGTALGLRARKLGQVSVWVLVGDAELEEGSNHEAIALAGASGLDNLHVVAIDNKSATQGWHGGLAARFTVEGWSAVDVNGRDHAALYSAFTVPHPGRPHAVIAAVESKSA